MHGHIAFSIRVYTAEQICIIPFVEMFIILPWLLSYELT